MEKIVDAVSKKDLIIHERLTHMSLATAPAALRVHKKNRQNALPLPFTPYWWCFVLQRPGRKVVVPDPADGQNIKTRAEKCSRLGLKHVHGRRKRTSSRLVHLIQVVARLGSSRCGL